MKIHIEDFLHKIDLSFKEKTKKDKNMTYVMIVSLMFAFSYLLFWDNSFEEFIKTRENVQELSNKINSDKHYLQVNPESLIASLDAEIVKINSEIIEKRETNAYIKTKIEAISFLIYDERTWGEYLDSISKNAQKYNMKISNFTNKYSLDESSFGHVLDITVTSSGSYLDTLNFINSLEQSDLVVDIHDLNISANKKLISDFNISVWGITY